jgi:hypothetical protein
MWILSASNPFLYVALPHVTGDRLQASRRCLIKTEKRNDACVCLLSGFIEFGQTLYVQ